MKNLRWLLSTPRHHAERTRIPVAEKNLHDANREQPYFPFESGRDQVDDPRRDQDADHVDNTDDQTKERGDHTSDAARHLFVVFGEQSRINRNERSGKDPFSEQVLQEVRDLQSRFIGARGR